ncbi:hypothetical protein CJD36_003200 [Flavipsychrobacter stenotrophus]|uniref:Uncharacterized protein n=1 Tax=Flavipsychrobacter stenotrophus TaxID=2077091 RepID=A0A2S7T0P2_9BACT|nr:hypothetical protein [Flavipsychrobacter stenotrophus]PQJ12769.1 hypothetical protein CJD36_003200 [Flavipsychrobacter stenotrophus]
MKLTTISRPLYSNEIALLRQAQADALSQLQPKVKQYHYLVAVLLGILFFYLAYLSASHSNFLFSFLVLIAVLCGAFVVFIPFEERRQIEKSRVKAAKIEDLIAINEVEVTPVAATRVAIAPEFEDECNMYVLEIATDNVLYLWDYDYNLEEIFPCLEFDVYDDVVQGLIGYAVNPLSEKVDPVVLDREKKWKAMTDSGLPKDMSIEHIRFDEVVEQFGLAIDVE